MDILIALGALVVAIVGAFFAGRREQRVDTEIEEAKKRFLTEQRIKDAVDSIDNDDDGAWRSRLQDRRK